MSEVETFEVGERVVFYGSVGKILKSFIADDGRHYSKVDFNTFQQFTIPDEDLVHALGPLERLAQC